MDTITLKPIFDFDPKQNDFFLLIAHDSEYSADWIQNRPADISN